MQQHNLICELSFAKTHPVNGISYIYKQKKCDRLWVYDNDQLYEVLPIYIQKILTEWQGGSRPIITFYSGEKMYAKLYQKMSKNVLNC